MPESLIWMKDLRELTMIELVLVIRRGMVASVRVYRLRRFRTSFDDHKTQRIAKVIIPRHVLVDPGLVL